MLKLMTLFSVFNLLQAPYQDKNLFDKISRVTWFEQDGFAGVTIVFMKSENGLLKCVRQINGSGVPVITSEVYDIEIKEDTIYFFKTNSGQEKINHKKDFYLYTGKDELTRNNKKLTIIFNEPIIHVWTNKQNEIPKPLKLKSVTKVSLESNEVYVGNEKYKLLKDK